MCVTGVGAGLKLISILFFVLVWNIVRKKALTDTEQAAPDLQTVSRQCVLVFPSTLPLALAVSVAAVSQCLCVCVCVCVRARAYRAGGFAIHVLFFIKLISRTNILMQLPRMKYV